MRRGDEMPSPGDAVIKHHGGGKHGGRGFRSCAGDASLGKVVNSSGADSEVQQPSNADSASEGWIYVRGHRIQKAGLHIDSHGNVYVPDSEEESGTEEAEACGLDVAAGMDLAVDLTPQVPKAVGVELVPEGDAVVDGVVDEVSDVASAVPTNKDVPHDVPEQLKEVLVNLDPIYHDVFVSLYKILVPICLRPLHG
jgi:hypothetical protein